MVSESINHVNYHKKIVVKKVEKEPITEKKVEVVKKETKYDATDVNQDGTTNLKDVVDVAKKIFKIDKKKRRK